jgi:hypothetical protein
MIGVLAVLFLLHALPPTGPAKIARTTVIVPKIDFSPRGRLTLSQSMQPNRNALPARKFQEPLTPIFPMYPGALQPGRRTYVPPSAPTTDEAPHHRLR